MENQTMLNQSHKEEVARGNRFRFGENWSRFLMVLNESRIDQATESLCEMLGVSTLEGKTFLDVGSGSGLFSLAARRLGATVHSFDYDPMSVACTEELKRRYYPDDLLWIVETGSILDADYLAGIDDCDVVYSWGVLHHTGMMWDALENVSNLPKENGGQLFIALYNNQGWVSNYWKVIKKLYNKNAIGRLLMIFFHWPYLFGLRYLVRLLTGRLKIERGMSLWRDMIDWLGGYPFEVAKPEEIFKYFYEKDYQLINLRTCGGRMGCNEFVFSRG